jgi:hypothetical protein
MTNIQTLQPGCIQTITVTPIDPDVVPISMTPDKTSGAAPLTVNVTLVYKNNTPNTISNAKALLWVGSTPTSITVPSVAGNGTISFTVAVSLTAVGSYAIRPEVPNGFTLPALYGDVLSKGVVDAANQTAIANFALNVPPAPTINQIAVGDLARNGSIQLLDASTIMAIYLGQVAGPQTVYTPVGRNVISLPPQTVTVTTPVVLPIQSSCSLPGTVPAGQDGSATVTVLAGNAPRNVAFQILKAGVVCATSATITVPGDSASHTYSVTIPAATCLGVPANYNTTIQMVLM